MPRSNTGPGGRTLTGGRALYTGKNAYASQGFENDTRQSQLGGLVQLYLWGSQSIPNGTTVYTPVAWGNYASPTFRNVFLRSFSIDAAGTLYCQKSGSYRFSPTVRAGSFPTNTSLVLQIQIVRHMANTRNFYVAGSNPDGANTADLQVTPAPFVVDLLRGDAILMGVQHTNGAPQTIAGGSVTGAVEDVNLTSLLIEQIDLPAPA